MKKKPNEVEKKQEVSSLDKKITRKEALKKAGLMAVSATTMMVMLNNNSQAMVKPKNDFKPSEKKGSKRSNKDRFNSRNWDPRTSPGRG